MRRIRELAGWINTEIVRPYVQAPNKKPFARQAREIAALWRRYGMFPAHYFTAPLFQENDGVDACAFMPARIIEEARARLNGGYDALVDDKMTFARRASRVGLPQPKMLFFTDEFGRFMMPDGGDPLPDDAARARVDNAGGAVFVKPRGDAGNDRAFIFRSDLDPIEWLSEAGEELIVQQLIPQHPDMARFNESSVNTIRIGTFLHKGR